MELVLRRAGAIATTPQSVQCGILTMCKLSHLGGTHCGAWPSNIDIRGTLCFALDFSSAKFETDCGLRATPLRHIVYTVQLHVVKSV